MDITIYHNPDCGTSRNTLAMIRGFVGEPTVVEYIKAGWERDQLIKLFSDAGLTPKEALRVSKTNAEELGLTNPETTNDQILDAMIKHPILVNRPIVVTDKGVALCRPSETVFAVLDVPSGSTYKKEDGETITAP